jgi:competence protein ComEA
MLKKLMLLFVALGLSMSALIASAVEVNTADETALESVKGIGPAHAKAILEARAKGGPFKDADDLANRVKGIGPKSVQNLEAAGLTINGSSAPPAGKPAATSKSSKSATSAAPAAAATTATTPNPMTTTQAPAATPATPAPQAASAAKADKSKRASKKDKAAAAASAPEAGSAAAAPGAASDTKAKKTRKSKKDNAASNAAASGT